MKIDFDFELEGMEMLGIPSGVKVEEDAKHVGKLLSSMLAKATETENPVKFFDWALTLYKKQPLDIDKSDAELLKRFIKSHKGTIAMAQAQMLNRINQALNEAEK